MPTATESYTQEGLEFRGASSPGATGRAHVEIPPKSQQSVASRRILTDSRAGGRRLALVDGPGGSVHVSSIRVVAARKRSRGKGSRRSRPKRPRHSPRVARFTVSPYLTRTEARELKARAEADLRPVANYVSYLMHEDLRGKRRSNRRTTAKPGDKRLGYELVVPITIPDRRELEERARKELRSLSGYVAKLILVDLAK